MNEYNEIIYNKKVEKIDMTYLKEIKKYNYDNKIENLSNIKDWMKLYIIHMIIIRIIILIQ